VSCVFCKIVSGEIPATIVSRTDDAVAFRDLNPQAPTHVLVVPTTHVASLAETATDAGQALVASTLRLAVETARDLGLEEGGYRVVVNTGAGAGQSVFHLHLHLLAGRPLGWPPG
jgi:histidine triad (HIT) family protein